MSPALKVAGDDLSGDDVIVMVELTENDYQKKTNNMKLK